MPRESAQKRIHYVRVSYNRGARPRRNFENLIVAALEARSIMVDTEVQLPGTETLAIQHRDVAVAGQVRVAIGMGVPDEGMSTMGLRSRRAQDVTQVEAPPQGRAFKLADAFCLLDEDDLLICTDGSMRVNTVEAYFRGLMALAGFTPAEQAFQFITRMNSDQAATLAAEGVKELKVRGTVYAASDMLDRPNRERGAISSAWHALITGVRQAIEAEVENDAERQALANHFGELNIETRISVDGGSRGEPIVLNSLEEAAKAAQEDAPEGATVTLVTKKNNEISVDTLTLRCSKSIKRREGESSLDHTSAWDKLVEYRRELIDTRRWKR